MELSAKTAYSPVLKTT